MGLDAFVIKLCPDLYVSAKETRTFLGIEAELGQFLWELKRKFSEYQIRPTTLPSDIENRSTLLLNNLNQLQQALKLCLITFTVATLHTDSENSKLGLTFSNWPSTQDWSQGIHNDRGPPHASPFLILTASHNLDSINCKYCLLRHCRPLFRFILHLPQHLPQSRGRFRESVQRRYNYMLLFFVLTLPEHKMCYTLNSNTSQSSLCSRSQPWFPLLPMKNWQETSADLQIEPPLKLRAQAHRRLSKR